MINPEREYETIAQAITSGNIIAYDRQEKHFVNVNWKTADSLPKERYVTDLPELKTKIEEFIKENGINENQKKELTNVFHGQTQLLQNLYTIEILKPFNMKMPDQAAEAEETELQKELLALQQIADVFVKATTRLPPKEPHQPSEKSKITFDPIKVNIPTLTEKRLKNKSSRVTSGKKITHENEVSSALTHTVEGKGKPTPIRQLLEQFETEKTLYKNLQTLVALSKNNKYIAMLKNPKIGKNALSDLEISTIFAPFQHSLIAVENYLIGLNDVAKFIEEEKYEDALKTYAQLVSTQYEDYVDHLKLTPFINKLISDNRYATKFQEVDKAYSKNFPNDNSLVHGGISVATMTPVQRPMRHGLFANEINKIINKPEGINTPTTDLQKADKLIKNCNKKLNKYQNDLETFASPTSILVKGKPVGYIQHTLIDAYKTNTNWQKFIEKHNWDRKKLEQLNRIFNMYEASVQKLIAPLTVFEEDPGNLELAGLVENEIKHQLKQLDNADHTFFKSIGLARLEGLENAIKEYNGLNKDEILQKIDLLKQRLQFINLVSQSIKE